MTTNGPKIATNSEPRKEAEASGTSDIFSSFWHTILTHSSYPVPPTRRSAATPTHVSRPHSFRIWALRCLFAGNTAGQLSWLQRSADKAEVAGSIPVRVSCIFLNCRALGLADPQDPSQLHDSTRSIWLAAAIPAHSQPCNSRSLHPQLLLLLQTSLFQNRKDKTFQTIKANYFRNFMATANL